MRKLRKIARICLMAQNTDLDKGSSSVPNLGQRSRIWDFLRQVSAYSVRETPKQAYCVIR